MKKYVSTQDGRSLFPLHENGESNFYSTRKSVEKSNSSETTGVIVYYVLVLLHIKAAQYGVKIMEIEEGNSLIQTIIGQSNETEYLVEQLHRCSTSFLHKNRKNRTRHVWTGPACVRELLSERISRGICRIFGINF